MPINITYLKSLLYNYVRDYLDKNKRKRELDYKKSLYEELIKILNSSFEEQINNKLSLAMLLENIYGTSVPLNHITKLLNQMLKLRGKEKSIDLYFDAEQQLNDIKEKVNSEYQELLVEREQLDKYLVENAIRKRCFVMINYKLKNSQPIVSGEFEELSLFFDEIHLEPSIQVKLFEHIKIHNMNCKDRFSKHDSEKYKLLNMMNFGFEIIDDGSIDYDSRADKEVELQYKLIEYYDIDEFIKQLPLRYTDTNLLQAVVVGLINKIQSELSEQIELIKDKDFYIDRELRDSIYGDFSKKLEIYIHLRNYYDTFENEQAETIADDKILVYAERPSGKPYILDDIEDVPTEYLTTVSRLLDNLKSGNISKAQFGGFGEKYPAFRKLKRDQIRIVLKLVAESTYCVLGVGVKKEQRGNSLYSKLCSREAVSDIPLALTKKDEIEDQLYDYIRENATKGNR